MPRFVRATLYVLAALVAFGVVGIALWPGIRNALDPIPPELDNPEIRAQRRLFPWQPLKPAKVRTYSPPVPKTLKIRDARVKARQEEERQSREQASATADSPTPAVSP